MLRVPRDAESAALSHTSLGVITWAGFPKAGRPYPPVSLSCGSSCVFPTISLELQIWRRKMVQVGPVSLWLASTFVFFGGLSCFLALQRSWHECAFPVPGLEISLFSGGPGAFCWRVGWKPELGHWPCSWLWGLLLLGLLTWKGKEVHVHLLPCAYAHL